MDRPGIEIRPASAADLSSLVDLLGIQLDEHGVTLSAPQLGAAVEGLLRRPQLGALLIAVENRRVVGLAALSFLWTLEHGGRAAWLDELYVKPERRGRGIGRALLREAYRAARSIGARALDLEVEKGHERVGTLYAREGFRALSRRRWSLRLPAPERPQTVAGPFAPLAGGCACGSVRYRVTSPPREVSHCHCSMCRRASGAPFVTWATVDRSAFELTSGGPLERRSSAAATRGFCGACGTPLTFREAARPERIDVTVGSFDRPEALVPDEHVFTSSQLPWLRIDDDLPRYERDEPAEPIPSRPPPAQPR
ncbi:MAG: GNAT family N-acetyltransferase [Deltaproteobacteria bacterium]|nr:GNAT family N-acetyltransferase [Deltaproteobacteria bacterium]